MLACSLLNLSAEWAKRFENTASEVWPVDLERDRVLAYRGL